MQKLSPKSYKKLVKLFTLAGFKVSRISGDHIIMTKAGVPRPVVIPKKKSIPVFIILNNLRNARISKEEYKFLLRKV